MINGVFQVFGSLLSDPETGTRRDSYMSATEYFDYWIDENPA
jgi:hypothetical protein